jgi:hypothetical protein
LEKRLAKFIGCCTLQLKVFATKFTGLNDCKNAHNAHQQNQQYNGKNIEPIASGSKPLWLCVQCCKVMVFIG